ncbi:MAG: hypothetical protein IJT96_06775 [Lachnospiraceae bacterium]|nr:hypothetical protein [Lachnospiraceae bacterium]
MLNKALTSKMKITAGVLLSCLLLSNINLISANAATTTTTEDGTTTTVDNVTYTGSTGSSGTNPSSTYNEGGSEGTPAEEGERYSKATTTNPFLMPGNTWVTPEATYGQDCIVVLPIVNMFKYNITDIIITPRLGARTDDFPFEISNTGYTQKVDVLVGEDAQPNYADRIHNCVWVFRTRENVKTGYYKLDFDITYTDPTCAVDTTVISVFVKTTGLPENGTIDGDGDKKLSMPRLIVKGFTTTPAEVYSGEQFTLNLSMENTSRETTVKNLQFDLTATVEGSTTQASYAAFLPTSGSNSFYIDSISPGGVTELTMDFEAKSGLEQRPYVMSIVMKYEDERANAYDSTASITIPVKQVSKFDTSTPTCEPSVIDIGEQSDLMFSIYNTGKTTLYNVQVTVNDKTVQPALAYVGNLAPGATGNVDVMLTGKEYSESETATIPIVISYEDETGSVSTQTRNISLGVQQAIVEDWSAMEELPAEESAVKLQIWQIVLIAVGGLILLIGIIAGIKAMKNKRKKREEEELALGITEYDIPDGDNKTAGKSDKDGD